MRSKYSYLPGIHRLAIFLAAYVILLITAGGLVKSLEAGLSVPDWPLSYGMLNPPRWWEIETVRAEHGHRLIAGLALLMTVWLVVWIARREPRRWVRRLSYLALGSVLAQALLGGITVLFFLPKPISVAHAGLAQLFLCMVVTLGVVTSRGWIEAETRLSGGSPSRFQANLAFAAVAAIYTQILLGAVMRHAGAGLAIPDFPWVFGGLIPPTFDFGIGIHYAHRVGALIVLALVALTVFKTVAGKRTTSMILLASSMALIAITQAAFGAFVVLTERAILPNTLHVGLGALLLATSLGLSLVSCRRVWIAQREPNETAVRPVDLLEAERVVS